MRLLNGFHHFDDIGFALLILAPVSLLFLLAVAAEAL